MDGRIDWSELFFSSRGRTPRTPFLIAAAVLIALTAFYESVVPTPLHWLTGVVVYPALIFSAVCVFSKRLHDRGKSGWWAAPLVIAIMMVWPHPEGVFDFFGLLMIGWGVVELGLMSSEQGANRFGPNPMRGPAGALEA